MFAPNYPIFIQIPRPFHCHNSSFTNSPNEFKQGEIIIFFQFLIEFSYSFKPF